MPVWNVLFRHPQSGEQAKGALSASSHRSVTNDAPANYYHLMSLTRGEVLQLSIDSNESGQGFVLIDGAGPTRLSSHQVAFNQLVGEHIGLVGRVYEHAGNSVLDTPQGDSVTSAVLRVTTPDNQTYTIPMYDDGRHRDGVEGDGSYGAEFLADRPGEFRVQLLFSGHRSDGAAFFRTAEHIIPVIKGAIKLLDEPALATPVGEHRLRIKLGLIAPQASSHYRAFAEVWGMGSESRLVPIAWIGGMTVVADNESITLGFDRRWAIIAGAKEPFELRNVRIEDPDYFITLASSERLAISTPPDLPLIAPVSPMVPDEEMLMGPRPTQLSAEVSSGTTRAAIDTTPPPGGEGSEVYTDGTGHILLLVHGYCSGDVWGPVKSQFTNSGVFQDFDQNFSIDAFAQRIKSAALTWNSYAIVAHSQGGMAALHLYTNYWSGLDNAGPGRLIQSVGTPYQGTPLMSVNGFFGGVFQCGYQANLTPSGATAWLSGIPTSHRAKVNYYTTSFTDYFLQDDWCNYITDVILDAPDDGVTEQSRGQLPGAVNQGHTIGQCHTTGLGFDREGPQYQDSNRNAIMNINAAVGPPVVATSPASNAGQTAATLNGTVNPSGSSTTTLFEYGTTTSYGSSVVAQTRTGFTTQNISANASLSCGTVYHFRAKGTNAAATRYGLDQTFSTLACPATRIVRLVGDLTYGNVTVGQTAARTLTIFNDGNSALGISNVGYPSGFSGNWGSGSIPAGGSQGVSVTFAPTSAIGYGGTITASSDKTSGTNTTSCSGTGVSTPTRVIRLVGDLAYGSVTVGQTPTRMLTIYNDGNSALNVSSIGYPPGFSGNWSGSISAGGSQGVSVTFGPTSVTSYGGTVAVNSDKTSGTNTTSCSGSGATQSCLGLNTNVSPAGVGSVTVNTGSNCLGGGYSLNTPISLTANTPGGYTFSGWSGSGGGFSNSTTSPTTFTITGSASVTATFTNSGGGAPHSFIDVIGATAQAHDLTVGPDGSVFVLFPTFSPTALAVVKSTDGGMSWSSPVSIPNSAFNNFEYHLVVDSGGVLHVVWWLGNETYYSRSTNGGASFSSPIQVRSGNSYNGYRTNNAIEPVVASDGAGNVYVAYGAYTKDSAGNFVGYNVWVSQSTNGGATFLPEFSINTISSTQKIPRKIRATLSNFYVLYMDETNNDLYFYRRYIGAASGNTGRLNTNMGTVQYDGDFAMAPNEMTFYGTYSDTTGDSEGNITFCKSTDGGITWPVCRRVNDSANRQQHTPRVGLDGLGNLHMAWADGRSNGRLQIYYAYSADGGANFSSNVNLSLPVTQTDFSQTHVTIDNQNSAVYVSATRNYSQVVVARLPMTPSSPGFYLLTPCRLIDTRNANGAYGGPSLNANTTRNVAVAGVCGIPAGTNALSVNITSTGSGSNGWLTLFPGPVGASMPFVSTINYSSGRTLANNAVVRVGSDGTINIYNSGPVGVHCIVDVNGYFK